MVCLYCICVFWGGCVCVFLFLLASVCFNVCVACPPLANCSFDTHSWLLTPITNTDWAETVGQMGGGGSGGGSFCWKRFAAKVVYVCVLCVCVSVRSAEVGWGMGDGTCTRVCVRLFTGNEQSSHICLDHLTILQVSSEGKYPNRYSSHQTCHSFYEVGRRTR